MMSYSEYYNANEDFRQYVDKHCQAKNCTVDEALQKKMIQAVADFYYQKEREEQDGK